MIPGLDTELSQTPEHQAAHILDVAAAELETLRRQALDFAEVLNDRIRTIRSAASEQRRHAFDRYAPAQEVRHVL